MEKIIPVISSGTEGPLGVKHLPRLWLKTLLGAAGRLPKGYKDIRPGFDYMVLEGLGINPDSARDFIFKTSLPISPLNNGSATSPAWTSLQRTSRRSIQPW